MLKILIFIDSLGCGGAEKSLVSLLPSLVARGYDVTMMVMRKGGAFERFVPQEVKMKQFPFSPNGLRNMMYSAAIRLSHRHTAETYWKAIGHAYPNLEEQYDVAIAYQQGFPTYYIAEKVKAKKKICWVNAPLDAVGYSKKFNRPFYDKYHQVVCVSDILRDRIIYPGFVPEKSKLITVYDILNESVIRSMSTDFKVDRKARTMICTVGRLVKLKGYDLAIEAAAILRDKEIDFEWHFVGGGMQYRHVLEKLVLKHGLGQHIVFEGEQVNPYPYMAAADIYVQPSKKEGFGMTIGEAKILGKPIVSTNFPVVYNQITNEVNGLVAEMSPKAIADSIMRLLNDDCLRNKLTDAVSTEHNTTAETESAKVFKIIED